MPLATGDKLGPYQILSAIGAGGMGEVYKARHTRLECTAAGSIELLMTKHSKPAVKQHLASIRMLFDWLVTGQVISLNPVHSVRGPSTVSRKERRRSCRPRRWASCSSPFRFRMKKRVPRS